MKMKRWAAAFLTGCMCLGMMTGCEQPLNAKEAAEDNGTSYDGTISLIISEKDEYLSTLDQAAKAAAVAKGCTYESVDCGDDMDRQIEAVQAAVQNGSEVLIVVLADDTRADEVIEAAGDAKVVFVNRIPQDESVLDEDHIYVGSDESESGTYQGEMLAEAFAAEGKTSIKYLLLQGTEGLLHTTSRTNGAIRALIDAGITAVPITQPIECDYDRTTAMEQVSVLIAKGMDFSDIDCIIANNDAMALGAIEALEQNDIDISNIKIVGVDGTDSGLQAIEDGEMLATVYQNAVGQAAASVQAAINLASGDDFDEDISYEIDEENEYIIWVPFEKVDADNVSDYY